MRTLTSGKGKVHHIPSRDDDGGKYLLTMYLCGQSSINAVAHEDGTVTCRKCQGKLRTDQFEAYFEGQRRRQRAEDAAAYEALAKRQEEEVVEYRDTYVQYAGHAYRVLGSEGDSVRYGLWVQHAQNDDEPVLFVRMGPDGMGDLVAQCLHAWGMASTITGEVIQWNNQDGHYVDRDGNERTDIQFR